MVCDFMGDNILLSGESSRYIYGKVQNLPIIDYHCHLSPQDIAIDIPFDSIGRLWLESDHYKWRAMRICGVDEEYITGSADWYAKFLKYAEILPNLAGNPLYYWTHLELRQLFGITKPLNADSAEDIYMRATHILEKMTVRDMLATYNVRYIATADDPTDDLRWHGSYGGLTVAPTFRLDKLYGLDNDYLLKLGATVGYEICTLDTLKKAIRQRLDYFCKRGCKLSDHGFERIPSYYATEADAAEFFERRHSLTDRERESVFGYLLTFLAREYRSRDMLMQLHFSVMRNVNSDMYRRCGADSGFDIVGDAQSIRDLAHYLDRMTDAERPDMLIYTLNDSNLPAIACVTGAFRNVRLGAAWWFNDTVEGIRKNLSIVSEYSALGCSYGMLTDSRSFSSYTRFDFFRRLLSDYLGGLVDKGEYDIRSAVDIARNICYYNIKGRLMI